MRFHTSKSETAQDIISNSRLTVNDLMTEDLAFLRPTDSVHDLRTLMERRGIRHVPVIDEHHSLVGICSQRDLLRSVLSNFAQRASSESEEIERKIPVAYVMNEIVATASSKSPLNEAANLMLNHKFGCIPIVDGRRIRGIVTRADFLNLFAHGF
jgi:CBS domain-containing membrane protein